MLVRHMGAYTRLFSAPLSLLLPAPHSRVDAAASPPVIPAEMMALVAKAAGTGSRPPLLIPPPPPLQPSGRCRLPSGHPRRDDGPSRQVSRLWLQAGEGADHHPTQGGPECPIGLLIRRRRGRGIRERGPDTVVVAQRRTAATSGRRPGWGCCGGWSAPAAGGGAAPNCTPGTSMAEAAAAAGFLHYSYVNGRRPFPSAVGHTTR